MRIRSTKPEFWRSKTIGELDWDTRLVLKALESYVDDNGVGRDQLVIFCADAFPHDLANSSEVCAKVSRSLSRLSEAGLIVRYTVAGEPLVYVRRWKQWQYIDKPKAGRYPRPDGTKDYREVVDESISPGQGVTDSDVPTEIREVSPEPPENVANSSGNYPQIQSGEQGNRGTEKEPSVALVRGVQGGTPPKPATGKPAAKRRTQIRDDYMPPKSVVATIRAENPNVTDSQLTYEHGKFIDHWKKTGKPLADWDAAWRNWMRTSSERGDFARAPNGHSPPNGIGKPSLKALGYQALTDQIIAEMGHE